MTNRYLRIQQSNKLLLNEVDNSGMGGIGLAGSRVIGLIDRFVQPAKCLGSLKGHILENASLIWRHHEL